MCSHNALDRSAFYDVLDYEKASLKLQPHNEWIVTHEPAIL